MVNQAKGIRRPKMPPGDTLVRRSDLVQGLYRLGVTRGTHLVVHSRLSSLGHVIGGPRTVIDGLKDAVTQEGTIVMPTYSGQIIFFLESLALKVGINGRAGTSRGVAFRGSAGGLLRLVEEVAGEGGITLPYADLCEFVQRIRGEGASKQLSRAGWSISVGEGEDPSVELRRDAPPLPAEDVVPWKMPAWTGRIPDTFWREPDTLRSRQYSGSFAAWGSMAERILEGHDNHPGQREEDHPLHRLRDIGGKVLLIGVDHRVNSTIHVAQWAAFRACKIPLPPDWREFLSDFQEVDRPLDRAGGQNKGQIGEATVRLADTRTLFKVVARLLDARISRELGPSQG
jgi:aminoglycoside N3'-acetyltransferase